MFDGFISGIIAIVDVCLGSSKPESLGREIADLINVEQWVGTAASAMEASGLYFGHGTDNAWDEACWMILHVLGLEGQLHATEFSMRLSAEDRKTLDELLAMRISTRKPLAYLLSKAWFAGLAFEVNDSVLVPRSPIAELIIHNLLPWYDLSQAERILDVGTGSGCIACAVAHYWPQTHVDAIDISGAAVALARHNVGHLGLTDRVRVVQSDLFSGISAERYDVIFANPPYVPKASMADLPIEYSHEPSLGLVAGEDGLDVVVRLVESAHLHLRQGGVLVCEVGEAMSAFDEWARTRRLEIVWLDFEFGGEGVFLATRHALAAQVSSPN